MNDKIKGSKQGILEIKRMIRAPAERIYKAFLDPDVMVKWVPPHGFTGRVTEIEVKVGGHYKMHFTNFSTGQAHSLEEPILN